ncbi:MAG: hypothetical protein JKP95_00985 [Oceanicaulis sp.]|nr:hypothetical protein [Oceanicaulis sp.]
MKRDRIENLKHNAKLDVRLPDQLKDEFLARCREEGVSSGAVIRSLMIDYVTARPRRWSVMAAGVWGDDYETCEMDSGRGGRKRAGWPGGDELCLCADGERRGLRRKL